MPEIVLTARRWSRRCPARARVVVVCAVGALAVWSFVVVATAFTQGPGASQMARLALPPAVTTVDPTGVAVQPLRLAPRALLQGVAPTTVAIMSSGEAPDLAPAGDVSAATPAGAAPVGVAADPDPEITPEETGGSGAPEVQPGQPGLSRHLEPGEQLVLRALGIAAPGLVPVVGDVFATTDALLDGVGSGLPIRLRAGRR